ncbi:MAG: hypothetical protein RL077_4268, partial [Verrucomicrobiota bacterium]
ESHPDAVRLGHVLAKSVLQRFRDQPDAAAGEIAAFAVESYRHAAVGRYALGNFAEALRLIEKARGLDAGSSALRFLQGKYLAAAGQHELAFAAVSALPTNDETIAAVSADLDLAASVAPRWLPGAKIAAAAAIAAAEAKKIAAAAAAAAAIEAKKTAARAAAAAAAAAEAKALAMQRGEMVRIPPGSFVMGSPRGGGDDERPVTRVTLTTAFSLGKTQVTQRSWVAVMGSNPSAFKGESLPVENVSWDDAMEFCRKLTTLERSAGSLPSGYVYTLPTEAQWEYACRAGTTGDYAGDLKAMAWFAENAGGTTHAVATKQANAWGLHDMHGNVWEWCADWYADKLPGGSVSDSKGPASGSFRVRRGGSWRVGAAYCRSAYRGRVSPGYRFDGLGFRLALSSVP